MKKKAVIRITFSIGLVVLLWGTSFALKEIYEAVNYNSLEIKAKVEMDKIRKEQSKPSSMVMVNGKLYVDTGEESDVEARCGTLDGSITSKVDASIIPSEDGECNFEGAEGYQYIDDGMIDIYTTDGRWLKFKSADN